MPLTIYTDVISWIEETTGGGCPRDPATLVRNCPMVTRAEWGARTPKATADPMAAATVGDESIFIGKK